jgi:hypothetical protein
MFVMEPMISLERYCLSNRRILHFTFKAQERICMLNSMKADELQYLSHKILCLMIFIRNANGFFHMFLRITLWVKNKIKILCDRMASGCLILNQWETLFLLSLYLPISLVCVRIIEIFSSLYPDENEI